MMRTVSTLAAQRRVGEQLNCVFCRQAIREVQCFRKETRLGNKYYHLECAAEVGVLDDAASNFS